MKRAYPAAPTGDAMYKDFGKRVRAYRTITQKKQEDLAEAVGLTRVSITNIELGRQRPPLHTIIAIAHALGVTAVDLLPDAFFEGGEP